MLNHARTLLMNVDGDATPLDDYPGEEAIDPGFRAVNLPTALDTVRSVIFGTDPDRLMLNYRCRQLLTLLHSTPLVEYVYALDPRVTYDFADDAFIAEDAFKPRVVKVSGPETAVLTFTGKPANPDITGRCRYIFNVDVPTSESVAVDRLTPKIPKVVYNLEVPNGLSNAIPLMGSGYSCRINTDVVGQLYRVEVANRPQRDLGQIAANLGVVGEPVTLTLFGLERTEPWRTFRNLWEQKLELPLKLGGLLCALIYRTEDRRLGRG